MKNLFLESSKQEEKKMINFAGYKDGLFSWLDDFKHSKSLLRVSRLFFFFLTSVMKSFFKKRDGLYLSIVLESSDFVWIRYLKHHWKKKKMVSSQVTIMAMILVCLRQGNCKVLICATLKCMFIKTDQNIFEIFEVLFPPVSFECKISG